MSGVAKPLRLPAPGPGKNYLVVKMDAELVDKAGQLQGHWEDELTTAIEQTVREFIRSRPIAMSFRRHP